MLTTAIRACRYFSLRCSSRAGSSGDFFEVAEAEGLDHLGLHGRDVLVGLVGAERRANDGAGGAAALGLTDELDDGLRTSCGFGASLPSNVDVKDVTMA